MEEAEQDKEFVRYRLLHDAVDLLVCQRQARAILCHAEVSFVIVFVRALLSKMFASLTADFLIETISFDTVNFVN